MSLLSAYGIGFHRHNSEINQELRKHTKFNFDFIFTPHLSPMFRGILSTIYVNLNNGISINKVTIFLRIFIKNIILLKY